MKVKMEYSTEDVSFFSVLFQLSFAENTNVYNKVDDLELYYAVLITTNQSKF